MFLGRQSSYACLTRIFLLRMRIISGRFKGHRLCSFSADFIRPMTDRVKTSVFNTLYSYDLSPQGQSVLDLFSGTGNLGLESLSRGARQAYLVDSSKKSVQIIKKNIQLLKIQSGIQLLCKDVFRFISGYKGQAFDLIFADPPFKKHWGEKILESCSSSQVVKEGTMLILESPSQESIPERTNFYKLFTQKKFGDKKILFYQFH